MTKKNDYVSKKFIKNYILNTKTKFSAVCHNLLHSEEGCDIQPKI